MTNAALKLDDSFKLDQSILRAYDIRGVIGESLNEQSCYAVGRAFGTIVKRRIQGNTVCVAYDGRETSPVFAAAVRQGLIDCGLSVYDLGLGPTPMVYYGLKELDADASMMITGSHSPIEHNGIKMALRTGPFWGEDVQEVGRVIAEQDFETGEGRVETIDITAKYVDRFIYDLDMDRPLKVAWDAGNGAMGAVLKQVTDKIPGEHVLLFDEVDGTFPNHHPDPTVAKNLVDLQKAVIENGCDVGIGFDGDGDRIGVVGPEGEIYWADILMAIYAREILSKQPGATIVADVKSSKVLFDEIDRLGGHPIMTPTGHSVIKAKMIEEKSPFGGELAGHICFADIFYGYDDGMYCAIRLLNILSRADDGFRALTGHLPRMVNTPEIRIPVDAARKFDIPREISETLKGRDGIQVDTMDGVRVSSSDGWWLLRASNTESVLSLRAEAYSEEGLRKLQDELSQNLKNCGIDFSFE
jgi:phosphomannomutase